MEELLFLAWPRRPIRLQTVGLGRSWYSRWVTKREAPFAVLFPGPLFCYEMQGGLNKKLHVCPKICLTSGVHAKHCALFCALSR